MYVLSKFSLNYLRRKVEGQKEGQLSFLKANIGSVMDQIDTLINLREKIEGDVAKFGGEPTLKLEKSIKGRHFAVYVMGEQGNFLYK